MFKVFILSLATILFFFISCQQQPVDSSEPLQIDKEGIVQSATGSGNFENAPGELRVFTFAALLKEDGSVNGNFMLNNHLTDMHISGTVIGLKIIGNEAFIGGVIANSNYINPAYPDLWQPGTCIYFSTIDYGEGSYLQDNIGLAYNGHPGTNAPFTQIDVLGFCDDPATFPWNPVPYFIVGEGNIQIKN